MINGHMNKGKWLGKYSIPLELKNPMEIHAGL